MTTDELITRARRAIETGQPNLAKLYMRKALEQTEQHRRAMDPLRAVRASVQAFADGLERIGYQIADALTIGLSGILDTFGIDPNTGAPVGRKSDYTLATGGRK